VAAGLQVFDQNGALTLDATYRVMRIIDKVYIGPNNLSGSVTDSRLAQGGFVSFQPANTCGDGYLSGGVISPTFSIVGNTLYWSYAAKNNATYDIYNEGTLFYGAS
jgi:hypothetical protein